MISAKTLESSQPGMEAVAGRPPGRFLSERIRFPWALYLSAAVVGGLAGLAGAAFHAMLDQASLGRTALRGALETAPVPGWLVLMAAGALILVTALWIVRRFAPETAGSGVQEVEAILAGERELHWRRVLPVKFIAGLLSVGSGLVLGREGPTIHMGAALGQMASERMTLDGPQRRSLIAAGAAAGLAAAFNAPLAAIVFVTEELREHFDFSFAAVQSVILACCAAVIVSGWLLGQGPDLPMADLNMAPVVALPMFLLLGVLIGGLGVLFNALLLGSVRSFRALNKQQAYLAAAAVGITLGALLWLAPDTVGGGESLVEAVPGGHLGILALLGLLAVRMLTTVGSYGVGLPGGIFAPMLALGTITGALFAHLLGVWAPSLSLEPGVFAVAAMGALFAATVRAPLTGIILVIELTDAQSVVLPIILTCLTATFTAEALGGRPVYSLLLGLGARPAPRAPVRRILAAGMILAAFVVLDHLAPEPRAQDSSPPQALAEASPPAPTRSAADRVTPGPAPMTPEPSDGDASVTPATPAIGAERASASAPASAPAAPAAPAPASTALEPRVASLPPAAVPPAPQPQPPSALPEPASTSGQSSTAEPTALADNTPKTAPASEEPAEQPASPEPAPIAEQARYSIQLISFRSTASLAPFARREGLLDQARTLEPGQSGSSWHPVLIGAFSSRNEAEAALGQLPARLRDLKPMIRGLTEEERLVPLQ